MRCAYCDIKIKSIFNKDTKRFEPISKYWKSSPPYYNDIVEVYCGPSCSLKSYNRGMI